ncbi:MAG: transketolase [Candidatus Thorarchaeota archaeon]|nr:transketolase [Candidatus Thorarchaeota archaeon]
MTSIQDIQAQSINAIRFLSADAIQTANSGHPGICMGAAALTYALWTRHLRFNPHDPGWPDRDRFVLSGGHGSMLLYAMLHLTGYDISLDQIKRFRQWGSITPGHPEYKHTPGVEVTTGPLGQGVGNAVGMAIAEAHLAAIFNRPGHSVIDHYTYALVTDGDLMEGISSEAASIAGHLKLGKLIFLYDDNNISIDGTTDLTFTENVGARFESFGWHVQTITNGNDVNAVDEAITKAKTDPRPSIIICKTHIGYGLPTKQDSAESHGAPPGEEELSGAKKKLGWPDKMFYVPEEVYEHFREAIPRGETLKHQWEKRFAKYEDKYPDLARELKRRLEGKLPEGWEEKIPSFEASEKGTATRNASGKVINAIASVVTELVGGSADLTPSNKTAIASSRPLSPDSLDGRNIHYGVREHSMGAIVNGMAVHGGIIPFSGTFFIFSDYMRPPIRLSAMSRYPSIWVFSHDSIGLGEDGPTHQPIEQLATLRAIPGLCVIRPADANEVAEAWRIAIRNRDGPTVLVFTRQKVPILDRSRYAPAEGVKRGAYVLADIGDGDPEIILIASGSEVHLITEAADVLASEGTTVRVVSFPSWELFKKQPREYQDTVLPPKAKKRLAVEAGVSMGWEQWIGPEGRMISIEEFGKSAPYQVLFEKFGFTVDNVLTHARELLGQ